MEYFVVLYIKRLDKGETAMAKETLKDKRGQTFGYIDTSLNGTARIYDKQNRKIGELKPQGKQLIAYDHSLKKIAYWDENRNITFDKMGRKISNGNILISLYFS
jgi:hypothetical protein